MRIVVISGSGSGIGAACARSFAAAGDKVIATVRDPERNPFATEKQVEVRLLDVTDTKAIESCIASVLADHGRIDVLVNSAGIHLQGAVEDMDEAQFRAVLETNFFGAINLTRAVLPAMRARERGHVISVSSIGAQIGRVMDGAYCASKAALEIAMEALRYEVARFGIQVCVVAPGAYHTGIGRAIRQSEHADPNSPYAALADFRRAKVREAIEHGGDPAEVAAAVQRIAGQATPPFRHVIGQRAVDLQQTMTKLDAAGRESLIIGLADIEWWLSGAQDIPAGTETDGGPP